ncbi:MAG: PEP-CTERM sorting domain-containing protein [Planctomycetota bacterium]
MRFLLAAFPVTLLFLCIPLAAGATIALPDGTLANDPNTTGTPGGVAISQTISPSFSLTDAPLLFSGTLDPSNQSNGDYGMGLTVGNLWFFFHPGFTNGAFRIQSNTVIEVGNQDMGFMPDDSPADFSIVLSDGGSGNFDATVTIAQGANTYSPAPFTLAASKFGPSGEIQSFGVQHNRFLPSAPSPTVVNYSNVIATAVPEPSSLVALSSLVVLLFARRNLC